MTQEWINQYRTAIFPNYKNITDTPALMQINQRLKENDQKSGLSLFCTEWGDQYSPEANNGILFVGRATNGWGDNTRFDVSELQSNKIFNKSDQMRWIDEGWSKPRPSWSGARSAFWRFIRQVTENFYKEEWYRHIAWSNLCKVSFIKSGNPSKRIFTETFENNRALLKTDIEMLSPKVIVMITGFQGWGSLFIEDIVGKVAPRMLSCSSGYAALFQGNGNNVIIIDRPERRKEWPFVQAVTTAIESLKN